MLLRLVTNLIGGVGTGRIQFCKMITLQKSPSMLNGFLFLKGKKIVWRIRIIYYQSENRNLMSWGPLWMEFFPKETTSTADNDRKVVPLKTNCVISRKKCLPVGSKFHPKKLSIWLKNSSEQHHQQNAFTSSMPQKSSKREEKRNWGLTPSNLYFLLGL